MVSAVLEAQYPLSFRKKDAENLGAQLRHRHSVDIIGMKRVGISNFLRFFLYHTDSVSEYISKEEKHMFIPVDLHDLVERELFPFWTLTLKRIVDVIERSDFPENTKQAVDGLFVRTIQTQDLFMAIDSVRKALEYSIEQGYLPTIFFIRFDRIFEAITPEFYSNLQGLKDATHHKLAYVFTSYRTLDQLAPEVFTKTSLALFCQNVFVSLASHEDMQIIYATYNERYKLDLQESIKEHLLSLVNGYVQYLQLSLIILHEHVNELPKTPNELFQLLTQDERIILQSEELWESLTREEKTVLLKIVNNEPLEEPEVEDASYLWDTGFVITVDKHHQVFSPLLLNYVEHIAEKAIASGSVYFSKKEHALFTVLQERFGSICEREEIIEAVWPETKDLGISDWAIDRLVARVRVKLKQQQSPHEIRTIRTRGYQLVAR